MKEKERTLEREQAVGSLSEMGSQGRAQGEEDKVETKTSQRSREAVLEE